MIITSNLLSNASGKNIDFIVDYNKLLETFKQGSNSLTMLVKLLVSIDISEVSIAGADGFTEERITILQIIRVTWIMEINIILQLLVS